jgi:hypothetical protein
MLLAAAAQQVHTVDPTLIWATAISATGAVIVAVIGTRSAVQAKRATNRVGSSLHADHEKVTELLLMVAEDVGAVRAMADDIEGKIDAHLAHHEANEDRWDGVTERRTQRDDRRSGPERAH